MRRASKTATFRVGTRRLLKSLALTKARLSRRTPRIPAIFIRHQEQVLQRQMFENLARSRIVIDSLNQLLLLSVAKAKQSPIRQGLNAVINSQFDSHFLLSKYRNFFIGLKQRKVKLTKGKAQKLFIEIKGAEGAITLFRNFLKANGTETLVGQVLSSRRNKTALSELASIFTEQGLTFCEDFFVTSKQLEKALTLRIQ